MAENKRVGWADTARKAVLGCKAQYMASEFADHYDRTRMAAACRKALDLIGGVKEATTEYRAEALQTAAMAAMGPVTEEMRRQERRMPTDPKFHREP